MAITSVTFSIHFKSLLPQCCVNKVTHSFSTHRIPCYHSDVAITFLTVSVHLKSALAQCCVNKVSYCFSTHISPCCHSGMAITFLTVSIHLKSLLPNCRGNNVSYCLFTFKNICCHNSVSIKYLTLSPYIEILATTALWHLLLIYTWYKSLLPQCCVKKRFLSAHRHIKILFLPLIVHTWSISYPVMPSTHTSPC